MRFPVAALLIVTTTLPALADNTITIKQGQMVDLPYSVYNRYTCYENAPAEVQVLQPPQHGKFTAAAGDYIMHSNDICDGRTAHSMIIHYAPDRNYIGPDSVTITFNSANRLNGSGGHAENKYTLQFNVVAGDPPIGNTKTHKAK